MFEREVKSHAIMTVKGEIDWENVEKLYVDNFCWRYDFTPKTFGQIVVKDGFGFVVKLTCYEKDPKAVYKNFFDDVYKDSCLEFFACFDDSKSYINCEMNSIGGSIMSIGKPDCERVPFDKILGHVPKVTPFVCEDHWSVVLELPFEDINKLYGKQFEFKSGFKFTGNIFKCGDETEFEHYGMYSRSIAIIPQFHRVEYFADFCIA